MPRLSNETASKVTSAKLALSKVALSKLSSSRLSSSSLSSSSKRLPSENKNRIVHIGLGQFAKAHVAFYTQNVRSLSSDEAGSIDDWSITGISLNSDRAVRQLAPQNYFYTINARSSIGEEVMLVDVIDEVLFAEDNRERAFSILLDETTRIVSLTITEKGYHQASSGGLDLDHDDIKNDVINWHSPRTAIGWLVSAIAERRQLGLAPFTVMSLDNLNQNGRVLRSAVTEFAAQIDLELADYISTSVLFPCSMVDRIVPAIDDRTVDEIERALGVRDEACVVTEAFSQWVLEDQFSSVRPQWERAGVQLCLDVEPFEAMKLSLLNGAHSAIAYIGCLCDLETVAGCMQDANVRIFIERLMKQEILPEVVAPENTDLDTYIDSLLERFSNKHLHHRCAQIAMDGSQKIPQRWVPILRAKFSNTLSNQPGKMHASQSSQLMSFALAAWFSFIRTNDTFTDPMVLQLKEWTAGTAEDAVNKMFTDSGLFESDLDSVDLFGTELPKMVLQHLNDIESQGARIALARVVLQQDK